MPGYEDESMREPPAANVTGRALYSPARYLSRFIVKIFDWKLPSFKGAKIENRLRTGFIVGYRLL
jgi:hypothetical protein